VAVSFPVQQVVVVVLEKFNHAIERCCHFPREYSDWL